MGSEVRNIRVRVIRIGIIRVRVIRDVHDLSAWRHCFWHARTTAWF